ncbi:MAG TPA: YceI family protein [Gammaproteobacteria bacterium]
MSKISFGALTVAAIAVGYAGSAAAVQYQVVEETSSVGFVGVQQGTKFNGRFEEFEAQIDLDTKDPTKGSIVGVVKLESVNTRDHDRDAALLDADWFAVDEYPEARFESTSIEAGEDGTYKANGNLTLKGQTKPVVMTFTFDGSKFNGTMIVNRFDFNVGEGWNDTSWVGQDVTVEVKLDLKPAS